MKKKIKATNLGFTLIEIMVVLGITGLLAVTVGNVMGGMFKAKNQSDEATRLDQSGSYVLAEIRKNVMSAIGTGMSCPSPIGTGGTGVTFANVRDGNVISIICQEGDRIASSSAVNGTNNLVLGEVRVTGCNNFISCDTSPQSSLRIEKVNFDFNLEVGTTAVGGLSISREYKATYVIRN